MYKIDVNVLMRNNIAYFFLSKNIIKHIIYIPLNINPTWIIQINKDRPLQLNWNISPKLIPPFPFPYLNLLAEIHRLKAMKYNYISQIKSIKVHLYESKYSIIKVY